jgi:hypothetical protein
MELVNKQESKVKYFYLLIIVIILVAINLIYQYKSIISQIESSMTKTVLTDYKSYLKLSKSLKTYKSFLIDNDEFVDNTDIIDEYKKKHTTI